MRADTGWAPPRFVTASTYGHYHSGLAQNAAGTVRYNLTTPDWRSASVFEIRWADTAFAAPTPVEKHPASTGRTGWRWFRSPASSARVVTVRPLTTT
jgi:hypothetical protein